MAILSGDLLVFEMFLAYTRSAEFGISPERTLAAIRVLSQTCIDVCRGQAREAELAGRFETTLNQYVEVIRLKTASVCRASCAIGATLGGGTADEIAALAAYGEALGLAFQVTDDVLEYTANAQELGKPLDSDMRNGRITLPLIYALQADPETHAEVVRLLSAEATAHAQLAHLLQSSGAISRAYETARQWVCIAREQLDALPDSTARRRLLGYANDLINRKA
jgi:geranylgeranyl diphosphate synthase type I